MCAIIQIIRDPRKILYLDLFANKNRRHNSLMNIIKKIILVNWIQEDGCININISEYLYLSLN